MRLLVYGGRNYYERDDMYDILDDYFAEYGHELLIINGDCPSGADLSARWWAQNQGVPLMIFPPAWKRLGHKAGPIRNGWMLKYGVPDLGLEFPGGHGTRNMSEQLEAAGIKIRRLG